MKGLKAALVVLLGALVVFGLGGTVFAFHDGGVAECAGCHTMHNSVGGTAVAPGGASYLLIAATPTEVCLSCHSGYGQMTADGSGWRAGGDYYWLTKTFSWESHGHTATSDGDRHGHNVVAPTLGINADVTLTMAPGGTYQSTDLGCNSCHDPHGEQGNVLLLYGAEDTYPSSFAFTAGVPAMISAGRKNNVSNTRHSVYNRGMSDWCVNCHTGFDSGIQKHVVDTAINSDMRNAYNAYVSTDNNTGNVNTAYWEIVPFELNKTLTAADNTASTTGMGSGAQVMCLSCHRAHASAFTSSGRWDFAVTEIAESHPAAGDTNAMSWDVANKYYGYTFAGNQRSLCNKCHVKD